MVDKVQKRKGPQFLPMVKAGDLPLVDHENKIRQSVNSLGMFGAIGGKNQHFQIIKLTSYDSGSQFYTGKIQVNSSTTQTPTIDDGSGDGQERTRVFDYGKICATNRTYFCWFFEPGQCYLPVLDITAKWIRFELTQTLGTTDLTKSASVDSFFDGIDPDPTDAGVTVRNLAASSNYVFEGAIGAKGIAYFDSQNNQWQIVQIECP